MTRQEVFTKLDAGLLAEAFPRSLRDEALGASQTVAHQLHDSQWTERFDVQIKGETILIPARLHFSADHLDGGVKGDLLLMTRCLQTRSSDGFQRQRALRSLLDDVRPWSAPFIVALIGEYIVEILSDISSAMSASSLDGLAAFVSENPNYWYITKQRVASYWDVYYRSAFSRSDYVGFKLTNELDAVVRCSERGRQ